jgi:hypothetical protein
MTRTLLSALAIVTAMLIPAYASAQDDVPEMITDRPDITESSQTVPRGYIQVETGVGYNFDKIIENRVEVELSSFDLLTTLFRIGLTNAVELRVSTLYSFQSATAQNDSADVDGLNGLVVGTKIHFFGESGARPDMGLIVDVGLPVGLEDLTGKKGLPGFTLAASHTFGERLAFAYNLGGRWNEESNFVFKYSGTLPVVVAKPVVMYVELFGTAAQSLPSTVSVDGGLAWQPWRNLQLDGAAGFALTEEGDDWFGTVGLSLSGRRCSMLRLRDTQRERSSHKKLLGRGGNGERV